MDVFALRQRLVDDYAAYIRSFILIRDARIDCVVNDEISRGLLWPNPLIQLNPAFQTGKTIDEMVAGGLLHPTCREIFALKEPGRINKPLRLHKHQAEAVEAAASGDNYVLTTGTGSGKSLAYIIPIVDYALRRRAAGATRGIKAIVVYPMNALANSQLGELEKFLCVGFPGGKPPVTFRRYTGQEDEAKRQEIITNPPDILLTNYVMLELLLTRPYEKPIVQAARGLKFLVLDELHTYRGRQGADVALLVRRVRDACDSPGLQCIGTSATLATEGPLSEQQKVIASVATRLFGAPVKPERVITETLRRVTPERSLEAPEFREALATRITSAGPPAEDWTQFCADPLASWIESTFGLTAEPQTGRLRRARPSSITGPRGAAGPLAQKLGLDEGICAKAIQDALLAGYRVRNPDTGFPAFAFRLHQFISRGDTVYASVEPEAQRHVTTQGQQFVPGDRGRVLLPLAFCRECGQEYYLVQRHEEDETVAYLGRNLTERPDEEGDTAGFLYLGVDEPWPEDYADQLERLPEDWLEQGKNGIKIKGHLRKRLPQPLRLDTSAQQLRGDTNAWFVPAPFRFCLRCGVAYGGREKSDYGKLATLSSEGRSTATTVLSLSALRALRSEETLERRARKLLSFTDNRQDASLQSGHFNDFVEVALLRAALYKAVAGAGPAGLAGLAHDLLAQRTFEALGLPLELYAVNPEVKFKQRHDTDRALREVLAYRVYRDLRRGWRVTAPNLEQCGLLSIHYVSLDELCAADEEWTGMHPALVTATASQRAAAAKVLLDYLRRELSVKVDYLDPLGQERIQQSSSQYLVEPWAIDESEKLETARIAFPRSQFAREFEGNTFVSARGAFGQYLKRLNTFPAFGQKLTTTDVQTIIAELFRALKVASLVEEVFPGKPGETPGYQVPASAFIWVAGDGTQPFIDPLRSPQASKVGGRVNPFFVRFYQEIAAGLQGIHAREHTAQVPNETRIQREDEFREGKLPVLYCSPTMELGVDIAQLNAVNLRNVPPTPANYAQRSGRAGRSGQPAIVFTYCTTGSPHDQYFFKRPERMVAGSVTPPRLDLANEDLVRAHVHAVWLAETGRSLGHTLKDVLDLSLVDGKPSLTLQMGVSAQMSSQHARERAAQRMTRILSTLESELAGAAWYDERWLDNVLAHAAESFDRAADRWRSLYRAAWGQRETQHRIIQDASRMARDKQAAKRLRGEAESQLELLTGDDQKGIYQSDFYSYRYFASEGFLPGYNFPRLPLSAYIPGRRTRAERDEFLSRPRFLAISEFGPQSIVYHEGSRYAISQVILPVPDEGSVPAGSTALSLVSAKFCAACGYLHSDSADTTVRNECEQCGAQLGNAMSNLFRMQNVVTKRRARINSDEEERVRMGYELRTSVRFAERHNAPGYRLAVVVSAAAAPGADEPPLLRLKYGDAATLWRINLGWRRRRPDSLPGFVLDVERGYWQKEDQDEGDATDEPLGPRTARVAPFVEDRRNCLLIEPGIPLSRELMASLQPALKNAIQVRYQLEDSELAAEPLPDDKNRRQILLYEAAEGGAGILRQLVDDPAALGLIAREALALCHFDPDTGEDRRRAPGSAEDCEAACYDCLMSYGNQPDHKLLDRTLLRDLLLQLTQATVESSPVATERSEHLRRLKTLCDSDLEREWLDFLEARRLRLPEAAQVLMPECGTRPDFLYRERMAAIYVDGPYHQYPERQARDLAQQECMEDYGYSVVRFPAADNWDEIVDGYTSLFRPEGAK